MSPLQENRLSRQNVLVTSLTGSIKRCVDNDVGSYTNHRADLVNANAWGIHNAISIPMRM
jgi:hypothetical protein